VLVALIFYFVWGRHHSVLNEETVERSGDAQ
jgi:hypothetical protein